MLEKPFTSNAEQARSVAEAAYTANKICLEAFHWRFHPAAHHVKSICQSGKYGDVVKISSNLVLPRGIEGKDNIRFKYSLAGGATMDLTYVLSSSSFFAAPSFTDDEVKFQVNSATARLNAKDKLVDNAMQTHITIEVPGKKDVQCYTEADLELPPLFGFIPRLDRLTPDITIECEHAKIQYDNFVAPWFNHSITSTSSVASSRRVLLLTSLQSLRSLRMARSQARSMLRSAIKMARNGVVEDRIGGPHIVINLNPSLIKSKPRKLVKSTEGQI